MRLLSVIELFNFTLLLFFKSIAAAAKKKKKITFTEIIILNTFKLF